MDPAAPIEWAASPGPAPPSPFSDALEFLALLDDEDGGVQSREYPPICKGLRPELQKEALMLPVELVTFRNSGDVELVKAFFKKHFHPDCCVTSNNVDEPLYGWEYVARMTLVGMETLPDSIVFFERSKLIAPNQCMYSFSGRGTRVDTLEKEPHSDDPGHRLVFGKNAYTSRWYAEKLSDGMSQLLSFDDFQRVQDMEDLVLRREALAQIEFQSVFRWTFDENHEGAGLPLVVAADHRYVLRDFGLVSVPRTG